MGEKTKMRVSKSFSRSVDRRGESMSVVPENLVAVSRQQQCRSSKERIHLFSLSLSDNISFAGMTPVKSESSVNNRI